MEPASAKSSASSFSSICANKGSKNIFDCLPETILTEVDLKYLDAGESYRSPALLEANNGKGQNSNDNSNSNGSSANQTCGEQGEHSVVLVYNANPCTVSLKNMSTTTIQNSDSQESSNMYTQPVVKEQSKNDSEMRPSTKQPTSYSNGISVLPTKANLLSFAKFSPTFKIAEDFIEDVNSGSDSRLSGVCRHMLCSSGESSNELEQEVEELMVVQKRGHLTEKFLSCDPPLDDNMDDIFEYGTKPLDHGDVPYRAEMRPCEITSVPSVKDLVEDEPVVPESPEFSLQHQTCCTLHASDSMLSKEESDESFENVHLHYTPYQSNPRMANKFICKAHYYMCSSHYRRATLNGNIFVPKLQHVGTQCSNHLIEDVEKSEQRIFLQGVKPLPPRSKTAPQKGENKLKQPLETPKEPVEKIPSKDREKVFQPATNPLQVPKKFSMDCQIFQSHDRSDSDVHKQENVVHKKEKSAKTTKQPDKPTKQPDKSTKQPAKHVLPAKNEYQQQGDVPSLQTTFSSLEDDRFQSHMGTCQSTENYSSIQDNRLVHNGSILTSDKSTSQQPTIYYHSNDYHPAGNAFQQPGTLAQQHDMHCQQQRRPYRQDMNAFARSKQFYDIPGQLGGYRGNYVDKETETFETFLSSEDRYDVGDSSILLECQPSRTESCVTDATRSMDDFMVLSQSQAMSPYQIYHEEEQHCPQKSGKRVTINDHVGAENYHSACSPNSPEPCLRAQCDKKRIQLKYENGRYKFYKEVHRMRKRSVWSMLTCNANNMLNAVMLSKKIGSRE